MSTQEANEGVIMLCPAELSPHTNLVELQHRLPKAIAGIEAYVEAGGWPFLWDASLIGRRVIVLSQAESGPLENWFLIGDIHGDFFALTSLLETARSLVPDFRILFLGDLVDRGEQHAECLVLLFEFAIAHPGRVCWLAGNHDIAFSLGNLPETISSSVSPSECAEYINAAPATESWRSVFGGLISTLPVRLPRAVLFADGLLVSHGGFPLTDLLDKVSTMADEEKRDWLESSECLQDFTWTRLSRFPHKIPNRIHKGCQYGYRDFHAFRDAIGSAFPVQRLVVGHEHPSDGWERFDGYPAVVLSGFGFDYLLDAPGKFSHYKKQLVMARGQEGSIPIRINVSYDPEQLSLLYQQAESLLD